MRTPRTAAAVLLLAALAGCVGERSEPRSASSARTERGQRYTVRPGDTLSAIAGRLGVDMRGLAAANDLAPPYIIHIGQRLTVPARARVRSAEVSRRSPPRPALQPQIRPVRAAPAVPLPPPAPPQRLPAATAASPGPRPAGAPRLAWPADGPVSLPFATGGSDPGGIVFAAHEGAAVRCAATGTVIYAGDEPTGEGRRVLVDHGNGWVTAYRHLGRLTVQPGERVAAGARLGFVGPAGRALAPSLRFELRQGERAFDPLPLLPPRF